RTAPEIGPWAFSFLDHLLLPFVSVVHCVQVAQSSYFSSGVAMSLSWLAGSRPGGRGTFLCFAKEKYPKERRAEDRAPAGFLALLGVRGEVRKLARFADSNTRTSFSPHPCAAQP